jgi:hypothetical protein
LSWTRESRDLKFSRAISGQSAASAAHLPRQDGRSFQSYLGSSPRGSFGAERESPRGLSCCPTSPGVPDGRTAASPASRGLRQGVSGAAAAGDGSRTGPVPCGTTCPCGPTDLPPTEGRTSWRAVNSLTRRWSAKILHGCWRGRPPTILMRLSKNRSVIRLQRPWRLHRVGGLIGRPGRWSPGLYPVPTQPPAPLRKFLGSPGGCQERTKRPGPCGHYQPPGSTPGEAAPAALSGFHTVAGRESA